MATIDFKVKNGLVVQDEAQILGTTDASSSGDTAASLYTAGGIAAAKKVYVGTDLAVGGASTFTGDLAVNGGDITTTATTATVFNANATTVNAFNAGTTVSIGAATGTTTINNANTVVTGDLAVNGGDITTSSATANLVNATATTVNLAGAGTAVNIGAATGTTIVKNNLQVDLDLDVRGGDITTNQTTFNLVNTTATTVNAFGAGTAVNIGATSGTTRVKNNLDVDLDINIDGGDITTSATTFNLLNTTATTVNAFGAATTLELGAATGTTNINNNLDVDGDVNIDGGDLTVSTTTFSLANTNATTVNFAGAGTSVVVGATSGTTNVRNNLDVDLDLNVDGGDMTSGSATFNVLDSGVTTGNIFGAGTAVRMGATTGTLTLRNPTVVGTEATVNLWNSTSTTVNAFNAATTSTIGYGNTAASTTNISTGAVAASNTKTLNLGTGGAASSTTNVNIGATAGGTLTINNPTTTTSGQIIVTRASDVADGKGQLYLNGLTGNRIDFNSSGTAAPSFTSRSVGTKITLYPNMGAATSDYALGVESSFLWTGVPDTTNGFKWYGGTTLAASLSGTGNLILIGDLEVRGGDITTNQTTFSLVDGTATTVNFGRASTSMIIGATTGTTNIRNNLDVDLDVNIDGGDITTSATTFNLINGTATTVNFAGAGTAITIGAVTGTTTIRNANTVVTGDLAVNGGDITTSAATFNLLDATATTINFGRASTSMIIGATTGTTNIRNNLDVDLDINIDGGDLTTSAATFNLVNANATTINFGQASTTMSIGATTGTTTVRNSLAVNGNTTLGDAIGDSVTINAGTFSTPNTIVFNVDDSTASGVSFPVKISHTTSGVPATGIGAGLQFIAETSANNNEIGMHIEAVSTDVTATSEDFDFVLRLMQNGAAATEKIRVDSAGNMTVQGDITVVGGDIVSAAGTASTLYNTTTTGNVTVFGAQTSGTFDLGGTGGTGAITIGRSTGAQTVSIANGVTASGSTKTVNIGANGASGSTTNINLGSTTGAGTITANEIIKSGISGLGLDFAVTDTYAGYRVIHNPTTSGGNADGMYIGYQNGNTGITRLFGGGSGTVSVTINAHAVNSTTTGTGSAVVNGGLGVANRTSAGAFYSSSGEAQVNIRDAAAGTYLGVGITDPTTGWSLSTNNIALKMDSTTYAAIGMAPSNGILYFARTLTANGTMSSWAEIDNTRKFYLPTNITSTSTSTGTLVTAGGAGIAGALFTGGGITNASGTVIRQRYDGTDNYSGHLGWHSLQLGNNGNNYIVGGRTAVGGALVFYTNNTNDAKDGAPNGTLVLTLGSAGTATFGTSSAVNISVDTTDALDFTASSTNDARGISFNGRTAVSADFNDGYLRLNNQSEFSNGVYIPNFLGIGAGANTSYKLTLGSATNAKILLSEATDPYIQFREGTTDRYYMQWNATLNAMTYYNQESGYHYYDSGQTYAGLIMRTAGTNRGYFYADNTNSIGVLDEGGTWAIKHTNDSHTEFYDAGESMFSIGVGGVTGEYGSVQTNGSGKGSYEGYSINGRCVFMHDGGNDWGIYDDVNNQWMIYGQGFGTTRYVDLRYNGAVRLATNSVGVDVTGLLTATTKSFLIDHPTKDGMKLQYACLEGPENGVYVRGKLEATDVIELPDYWLGLVHSDSITVNLTPCGAGQQLYVDRIEDNKVYVVNETGKPVKCFYTVYGERKDVDNLKVEF